MLLFLSLYFINIVIFFFYTRILKILENFLFFALFFFFFFFSIFTFFLLIELEQLLGMATPQRPRAAATHHHVGWWFENSLFHNAIPTSNLAKIKYCSYQKGYVKVLPFLDLLKSSSMTKHLYQQDHN